MTKINLIIIVIASVLFGIAFVGMAGLGWAYLELGYGLHPAISWPAATLCLVIPLIMGLTYESDTLIIDDADLDDLMFTINDLKSTIEDHSNTVWL